MKNLFKLGMLSIMAIFLMVGVVSATIYTFGDNYIAWPGYSDSNYPNDSMGIPAIMGSPTNPQLAATITINDTTKMLEQVVIYLEGGRSTPDSLFINNNWNGTLADYQSWDYLAVDTTWNDQTDGSLYPISPGYAYTYPDPFNGTGGRNTHPSGINTSGITATAGILKDIIGDDVAKTITYDFNAGIIMGDPSQWIIGWTPVCANDAGLFSSVPEPSILLLLGFGLIGVGVARRKFFK